MHGGSDLSQALLDLGHGLVPCLATDLLVRGAEDEQHPAGNVLVRLGVDHGVVQDGEAVLRAIAEEPPDLLLLDVMMPHRSGYDVCQTIRADPALNRVRIVMLTAKGRDVERTKGLALGADDYVTKPFSTREVVARVREILARPPRS